MNDDARDMLKTLERLVVADAVGVMTALEAAYHMGVVQGGIDISNRAKAGVQQLAELSEVMRKVAS